MNCLNRVEVQEYVDNELSEDRRAEAEKHLLKCPDCREMYENALEDKELINSLLNQLNNDIDVHPAEFIYPDKKTGKNIQRLIVSLVAAASILTFIFLFHNKTDTVSPNVQESEMLVFLEAS
jgi:anti-sigma factor RsiW